MKKSDEQFEAFLREFDPREPQPLPLPALGAAWRGRRLAAAVVILAASVSFWLATRRTIQTEWPAAEKSAAAGHEAIPVIPKLSLLALTRMAQSDPRKFDTTLDTESRAILPGFQQKDSTLAPLAKE